MRIRSAEIDPVVVFMAAVVAAVGIVLGTSFWGVAAGIGILAAAAGSRSAAAWVALQLAPPPARTRERALVMRSRASAATMRRLVQSVSDGPLAARCTEMERQARAALPTIRILALHAFRVRGLAEGIPVDGLEVERAQTLSLIAGYPDERVRLELDSSLRSTESQLATGRRLHTLAEELFARTRGLAISMEAAAAGLAELQAISVSDPGAHPQLALASVSRGIDGLREGLEEAQAFSRNHHLEA